MQPLDCALGSVFLHRFGDLRAECRPVVERPNAQELDEGVELVDIVLHGCTRETPAVFTVQSAAGLSSLGSLILDIMRFIW